MEQVPTTNTDWLKWAAVTLFIGGADTVRVFGSFQCIVHNRI